MFSAKGAVLNQKAWGNTPKFVNSPTSAALKPLFTSGALD